ncbi:ubiquitin carboxyl-terminal hydrolase 28 isoform C [Patagioenas fasciata monilis]|uniref:ubiquitinyl hydrolase 1 n=1 Tax=Patagioenas fasciata monilis TaxID=372326 RepID=A0A1V4J8A0_PATFA|nr:ubiquitin carboxyl-terminal hydrolase 28 isoform C [Patagioenas fasciata monilis]
MFRLLLDCQMLLNQLKEITGIQDSDFLHAALKAADGDLTAAVTFLTEEQAQEPVGDAAAAEPAPWEGSAAGKRLWHDARAALGADTEDDVPAVARAPESPRAQAADRHAADRHAADRPQEPPPADSTNRSKRKRCEVWGENLKQSDWRRVGDWPVGMKNIGNTCWFSAVIQSLFQLPEFRSLVLGYSIPQDVLESCRSRTEKRNIAFMQELQCLFALMLGTRRKFVDPSAALELLRDAFRSAEEQQQDVSEFTHKLLDWLEDAFQLAVSARSPGGKSENPMVQLFYGTFLTEGVHEGNTFSKIETFGQYPLQVNGYRDLAECLAGAMVEGELEAPRAPAYGQQRWFTKLPPVLTFELSRFEFNQSLGQPEKIHSRLEFPQTIYMDRYLYSSKELVQTKREELKRLKEKMVVLQQKLERYLQFGSGAARFPLPDMLRSVLEFVGAGTPPVPPGTPLVTPGTPPLLPPGTPGTPLLPPARGQPSSTPEGPDAGAGGPAPSSPQPSPRAPPGPRGSPAGTPAPPAPRAASEEELNLVRTCLQRWRDEVEQDVQELKESIARTSVAVEQMYCDPLLQQVPYGLHAVLVHEGQANAGHYWAYVYDRRRRAWLKYNDVAVTEASWEELQRDSFGGARNASAYCLLYTRGTAPDAGAVSEAGRLQEELDALSPELRHYVQEENWRLEHEAEEWDEERPCTVPPAEPSPAAGPQELSSESGPDVLLGHERSVRSLSSEHARMAAEQTAQAIANTADAYERDGVEAALCEPKEVEPEEVEPEEAPVGGAGTAEAERPWDAEQRGPAAPSSSRLSEVEIPSVGKIPVRSDADGYNEEVMLSPAMQGVILAIAKARQTFDRDGSEAGLVKAFHEEYSRLYLLAKEAPTPCSDARLQHVLIYLLQNNAPQQVVERTLLEQFADKNLSYDERSISIMKVARAKLREIGPDDVDMEEYRRWHEDYSLFRKVSVYLLTGLELYQNRQYQESLTYLVYAYQSNEQLLRKGPGRGVSEALIALYRRKCLLKLNEVAAALFVSAEDARVAEGVGILNELIIPCMHLMNGLEISREDLDALEAMRSHWCSYLGREDMDVGLPGRFLRLQLQLGELLPRLLDGSSEAVVLKEPPKIRPNSPYDLCSRFAAVMESIHAASAVTVN